MYAKSIFSKKKGLFWSNYKTAEREFIPTGRERGDEKFRGSLKWDTKNATGGWKNSRGSSSISFTGGCFPPTLESHTFEGHGTRDAFYRSGVGFSTRHTCWHISRTWRDEMTSASGRLFNSPIGKVQTDFLKAKLTATYIFIRMWSLKSNFHVFHIGSESSTGQLRYTHGMLMASRLCNDRAFLLNTVTFIHWSTHLVYADDHLIRLEWWGGGGWRVTWPIPPKPHRHPRPFIKSINHNAFNPNIHTDSNQQNGVRKSYTSYHPLITLPTQLCILSVATLFSADAQGHITS